MSYHANIAAVQDLVEKIMPLVWAQEPETKLQVVGKDPGPEIVAMGEADKRIEVTGFVPDIRPYQAKATMAVCYVRYGVGLTNKTIESMAMGTPIVASPHAVSTLKDEFRREVLVGETPEQIAAHIVTLLRAPRISSPCCAIRSGRQPWESRGGSMWKPTSAGNMRPRCWSRCMRGPNRRTCGKRSAGSQRGYATL